MNINFRYFFIAGFINTLLSLKIWEPLVRLCYLAYLLHPIVMYAFYMNMQQTIMVNYWIYVSFLHSVLSRV